MEPEILRKWKEVKEALEKAGKTESPFYKRAAWICTKGKDPGPDFFFTQSLSGFS